MFLLVIYFEFEFKDLNGQTDAEIKAISIALILITVRTIGAKPGGGTMY